MIDDLVRRRLLADCDADQRDAITSAAAPLLVVAGAGSGKTRVLTRRIAWRILFGQASAEHVLALTFTRKAAGELRSRVAKLGLEDPVTAGTFHAVALAQLRRLAIDRNRSLPVVLESRSRLVARIVAARSDRDPFRSHRSEQVAAVTGEIEWAKARLVPPADYERAARLNGRSPSVDPSVVASIFEQYELEKRRRRVLDFDDLLARLVDEMNSDDEFRAAQRWRFRHLFVDELQDVNPAQLRLLETWLGSRADLFAVGDARQAIYGWNGADAAAVTSFTDRFPGASVLELRTNYRSTPQVVAVARSVLHTGAGPLEAPRDDGRAPTLSAYDDERAEAVAIAAQIRRAHRLGRAWADCAVLARTNAQLDVIAEALLRADIPVARGAVGGGPAVWRQALDTLAQSDDPARFDQWTRDLHLEVMSCLDPGAEDRGEAADPPTGDASSPPATPIPGRQLAQLDALARSYRDLDPLPTGRGFSLFLSEAVAPEPSAVRADEVELLTFHRAKGLEWPVVFVAGLEEGYSPISHAATEAQLDEEQRLVYVALSRASDELHCSWSRERSFGSRQVRRSPSPYLAALSRAIDQIPPRELVGPSVVEAALAESRAVLAAPLRTGGRIRAAPTERDRHDAPPARTDTPTGASG